MSEGTYGESYQDGGRWFSQDADGQQYLWTANGWVHTSSPEAQSVMADPSTYVAGVLAESEGYWLSQDANGNQYQMTADGWSPATSGYVDPAATMPAGAEYIPATGTWYDPATGNSYDPATGAWIDPEDVIAAVEDPAVLNLRQYTEGAAHEIFMSRLTLPEPDSDIDGVSDPSDVEPLDADVQYPGDFDPSDLTAP